MIQTYFLMCTVACILKKIGIAQIIRGDLPFIILSYRPIKLPIFSFINTHPPIFKALPKQHLDPMLHATVYSCIQQLEAVNEL